MVDLALNIVYDFVKEVFKAYNDVEENEDLLEGLKDYAEIINECLSKILENKHKYKDKKSIIGSLEKVRIALVNAKHIILHYGAKSKGAKFRNKTKMRREIDFAKEKLNQSLQAMQILGIYLTGAETQTNKPAFLESNDWKIDENDLKENTNIDQILGSGSFSIVLKGSYKNIDVAVKKYHKL